MPKFRGGEWLNGMLWASGTWLGGKRSWSSPPCVVFSLQPTSITHSCNHIQEHPHMLTRTIWNLSAQPLIASWQLSDHDRVMPILHSWLTAPWKVCFENPSPIWLMTSTHTPRQTPQLSLYYTYTPSTASQATPLCFTFSAHCQECQVFACACVCVRHSLGLMPSRYSVWFQRQRQMKEGSPVSILDKGLQQ